MIINKIYKYSLMALLLMAAGMACRAQAANDDSSAVVLRGYGIYDCHYATGGIGGAALAMEWRVRQGYALSLGMEYVSSQRISATLLGEATLAGNTHGKQLVLQNLYLWRHFPALDRQEFTGALLLDGRLDHARLTLGLCNRYIGPLTMRGASGCEAVLEPMNVMFALEGWWRNTHDDATAWNVGLRWSNYNDFVIERVANWFFSTKGYYRLNDRVDLVGEVGIHPVGSLNLTASYDGWFCHLGGAYRF